MAVKAFAASQYYVTATRENNGSYVKQYIKNSNTMKGSFDLCDAKEGAEDFKSYGAAQITIMSIWQKRTPNSENYLFGIEQQEEES